jgi:hypothetical protein
VKNYRFTFRSEWTGETSSQTSYGDTTTQALMRVAGDSSAFVDNKVTSMEELPVNQEGQYFCGICGWSDISTFPHSH